MSMDETREELQLLSRDELVNLVVSLQQRAKNGMFSHDSAEAARAALPGIAPGPRVDADPMVAPAQTEAAADDSAQTNYQQAFTDQTRRTALLAQVAIELNEVADVHAIVERVLRVISTSLQVTHASMVLVKSDGTVELANSIQGGIIRPMSSKLADATLSHGLVGRVLHTNQSIVLADVSRNRYWSSLSQEQQVGSAIAIPIKQARMTRGVLTVFHKQTSYFTSYDLLLLQGIVSQVSVALSAASRRVGEIRRREQALTLLSTSQYFTAERSFEDLAAMLQEKSNVVFDADYGLLFLLDTSENLDLIAPPAGFDHQPDSPLLLQAVDAATRAWQQGTPSIVQTNRNTDNPSGCVALPLIHNGHAIGAIVLVRATSSSMSFPASTWSLITVFASFIASTCANMQLVNRLRTYTETLEDLIVQRTQQLQHSRDMLRIVFDHVPDGLLLLDADDHVLAANHTFCHWFIGQHPRTVVGQSYASIWEECERASESHIEVKHTLPPIGNNVARELIAVSRKNRQSLYAKNRCLLVDGETDVAHYLERWQDVTEQEGLQQYLLFQERYNSLGRLFLRVTDQVRTPLQHVLDTLERCTDDQQSTDAIQAAASIQQDMQQITSFCISMHDLNESFDLARKEVNLNDLLRGIPKCLIAPFDTQPVRLKLDLDDRLPVVYGQADVLSQMFLGIILRAWNQLAPDQLITLTSYWHAQQRICRVHIHIPAITLTDEEMAHAFEPFHPATIDSIVSGLYISKRIVEGHAGHLVMTSTHQQGTRIDIALPAAP
jgi:K+-sensing histidine kinase KdpD